jgi:predicted RecA/RadA family phage recombinase
MHRIILSVLFALFCTLSAVAQSDTTKNDTPAVIQFSGLVVTGDSLTPVAFTTVFRARDQHGTITDNLGFFSLPAFAGDTIKFSSVGYLRADFVIPDTLTSSRYNMIQVMRRDTVQLETTFIYPWPTKERFREEFLSLDLPDSKEEIVERNLEAAMLYERMNEMGMTASENYRYTIMQETQKIQYAGQIPTVSLLNPIAWAQFIQAWRRGDFKGR